VKVPTCIAVVHSVYVSLNHGSFKNASVLWGSSEAVYMKISYLYLHSFAISCFFASLPTVTALLELLTALLEYLDLLQGYWSP